MWPALAIVAIPDGRRKSHHVEIPLGDDHYRLWMDKIGPYLGDWALGEGQNGMFIIQLPRYDLYCTDISTKTVSPQWRLMTFPENYTLWLHKSGDISDTRNLRMDVPLHGAPRLGPSNSRSQNYATFSIHR
jgi:hypothetical protein